MKLKNYEEARICLVRKKSLKIMYLTSAVYCECRSLIAWYNGATFWKAGRPDSEF